MILLTFIFSCGNSNGKIGNAFIAFDEVDATYIIDLLLHIVQNNNSIGKDNYEL